MKTSFVTSAVFALLVSACGVSFAADKAAEDAAKPKPGVVEAAAASLTGIVESIDYQTRMVTLKTKEGKSVTMEVGPEAVRFNEVKKGDQVKIDYLESVAVMVQSPSETIASGEASGSVIVRNQGKKPSGTMVDTQVVTATVDKIDAKNRKAVLKMPDGKLVPIDVAPDVTNLENVKKGDQVVVKYTRTLAVDVTKASK